MSDRKLIIMRGLPGSGKSTLAKSFGGKIFSTDDYWIRPDGLYDFNRGLLAQAHEWNQRRVRRAMEQGEYWSVPSTIVLDNTNIKRKDFAFYLDLAQQFGYTVEYAVPTTPWAWDAQECARRNVHGVPLEVIQRMLDSFEE